MTASALTLLWTAGRLALLKHTGIPPPGIHDEFSYLLGADTFAHGRVANPQHPLAKFFESPHELVRPVYASKYPPGQALFLALGQVAFGSPFYGVVIEDAVMIFSFCVMLSLWAPLRWAAAISACVGVAVMTTYWADSYWGGAAAATAAALLLIGVGYLRFGSPAVLGAVFALAAVMLFWTRPLEGTVFLMAVLAVFGRLLWLNGTWRMLLAAVPIIAAGAGFTAHMNKVITGSSLRLPYSEHIRQYAVMPPAFWFLKPQPEPLYSHPRLAAQYGSNGWEMELYRHHQPFLNGVRRGFGESLVSLFAIVGFPMEQSTAQMVFLLVSLMLLIPLALQDGVFRKMGLVVLLCVVELTFEIAQFSHYAAPAFAALLIAGAAWAQSAWRFSPWGVPVGRALIALMLISPAAWKIAHRIWPHPHAIDANWPKTRAALLARLNERAAPQLIVVRYPSPTWNVGREWVYNSADIDAQHIVFAHDLGPKENAALLEYYKGREVSLLAARDDGYTLTPISPSP